MRSMHALSVVAIVASLGSSLEARGEEDAPRRDEVKMAKPTLDWLRECVIRRGVSSRLVKIESMPAPEGTSTTASAVERIVLWTKTKRLTQSVVIALVGGGSYVRIQSSGLASVPTTHPRLARVMTYMLDRNFAIVGAQFARDAADGEIALRSDVPCSSGLSESDFIQGLEAVLRAADKESPRLKALLGQESSSTPAGRD